MDKIEDYLVQLLQGGRQVRVDDLGGASFYRDHLDVIASSRLMDEFLRILLEDDNIIDEQQHSTLIQEVVDKCIVMNSDPVAIRNAVEIIGKMADALVQTFDLLLNRANDSSLQASARGYLLLGAFETSGKNKSKRYGLIGYLVDVDLNDDPEYLKYVAKITGLCYSDVQVEDLVSKLKEFVNRNAGEDDALYELAMCLFTKAFNSSTHSQAIENFDSALKLFQQASLYDRLDAEVYAAAILALKTFIGKAAKITLKTHLEALKRAVTMYAAWDNYSQQLSWITLRDTELFYWYAMMDDLTHLLDHLAAPAWLEPIVVIESYLLRIYDCSRTIFKRLTTGSLEILIRPLIQAEFIEQPERVYLLEKWLDLNKNVEIAAIAVQLRADIESYKASFLTGNDEGAVSISLADAVPSLKHLPENLKTAFEEFVEGYIKTHTTDISLILKKQFNDLVAGLQVIETYNDPPIRQAFNTILYHSLKFLELRMDNTKANHAKAAYLFKNIDLPKEDVLQADYFEYMQPLILNGKVKVEEMNVAGGRADVFFEYLSFNFCTEVKKDATDTSFTALREKYLGQTKEYQNTSAKVGILLVLDLLPKPNGIGSFESNINLEVVSTASDPVPRGVVVLKVPANRLTPSAVKL